MKVDSSWDIKLADQQPMHSFVQHLNRLTQLREEFEEEPPNSREEWCIGVEAMCISVSDVVLAILRESVSDRTRLDEAVASLQSVLHSLEHSGSQFDDPDLSEYRSQIQNQIQRRIDLLLTRKQRT